jgi:hypothetical protein
VSFLTSVCFHTCQFGFLDRSCSAARADFRSAARLYLGDCTAAYASPLVLTQSVLTLSQHRGIELFSHVRISFHVLSFPPLTPHLSLSLLTSLVLHLPCRENRGGLLNSARLARQRANARVVGHWLMPLIPSSSHVKTMCVNGGSVCNATVCGQETLPMFLHPSSSFVNKTQSSTISWIVFSLFATVSATVRQSVTRV